MVESRCGVLCSNCRRCDGCVNIPKAVWGICKIKICCEQKKLAHCGACPSFPCKELVAFANDKEYGDKGQRLEQCREWAETAL